MVNGFAKLPRIYFCGQHWHLWHRRCARVSHVDSRPWDWQIIFVLVWTGNALASLFLLTEFWFQSHLQLRLAWAATVVIFSHIKCARQLMWRDRSHRPVRGGCGTAALLCPVATQQSEINTTSQKPFRSTPLFQCRGHQGLLPGEQFVDFLRGNCKTLRRCSMSSSRPVLWSKQTLQLKYSAARCWLNSSACGMLSHCWLPLCCRQCQCHGPRLESFWRQRVARKPTVKPWAI